jgi:hypothetical protein
MSSMPSIPRDKKPKVKKDKLIQIAGVTGKSKKFNADLHQKFDIEARDILKHILCDYVRDNENEFGEDLIFDCKELPYKYIEVQVCGTWTTENYPYDKPFVYARKMRFSKKTLFITFSKDYTRFIMFSRKVIDSTPSRLKKYAREVVHFVPWNNSMKTTTSRLTLNLIKSYAGVDYDEDDNDDKKIDT